MKRPLAQKDSTQYHGSESRHHCGFGAAAVAFFAAGLAHSRTLYSMPEAVRRSPAAGVLPHLSTRLSGWRRPSASTKSLSSLEAATSAVLLHLRRGWWRRRWAPDGGGEGGGEGVGR